MNVAKRDYYEVLSVSRDCDEQTLKTSYRKLALQYHPDRNPGNREAEEKFKEAAEAYAVLSDTQKRTAYDRFGHQGLQSAAGGGFDPGNFDLSDILGEFFGFGDMFGSGGARRRTGSIAPSLLAAIRRYGSSPTRSSCATARSGHRRA